MVAEAIKIVQILPELNAGGVERGTVELADFLVRQGHDSVVISQGGRMVRQLVRQGSTHLQMPFIGEKTPRSLLHWLPLRNLFKQGGIDIIHLRSRVPAWVAYLAWKSLPTSQRPCLITTFHGFYSVNPYSAIMTKGQRVIAISKAVADHIKAVYKTPDEKIRIIYRGVDEAQFHPDRVSSERVNRIKSKWGLGSQDAPIIVLPGRVTFWKGHEVLIDALNTMGEMPWRAVCVGAFDPASSHYRYLVDKIAKLKLSDVIQFVGHEQDMPAVYAAADVVVSAASAEAEAFGRVSIEAQAMGRPIVASAHGGSLETVDHGQTGRLFQPGDSASLARDLTLLLANPDLCRQYGQKGIAAINKGFTHQTMCENTLQLYAEMLLPR